MATTKGPLLVLAGAGTGKIAFGAARRARHVFAVEPVARLREFMRAKANEDRIALLFEITRINKFATKGCAIVCHVPKGASNAKDGKFGTTSAAEKGDLWHWKAARSDPAGFADDTWLTQISEKKVEGQAFCSGCGPFHHSKGGGNARGPGRRS